MNYVDLIKSRASDASTKEYPCEGKQVAITIRMPKDLHESNKEAVFMREMGFSAFARQGLIQKLAEVR